MEQSNEKTVTNAKAAPMSRRALLAGASKAAVPAIVTLYSGAALAASSNLVSSDSTPSPDGNLYRCLDTDGVRRLGQSNKYDLGTPPMAHVTQINSQSTYVTLDAYGQPTTTPVTGVQMCANGDKEYYRTASATGLPNGKVYVAKGVIVSGTAIASFANVINYTNI